MKKKKSKHKHKWYFVEKIVIDDIDDVYTYEFVCTCGEVRIVTGYDPIIGAIL